MIVLFSGVSRGELAWQRDSKRLCAVSPVYADHTSESTNRAYDIKRSTSRCDCVCKYAVSHGINAINVNVVYNLVVCTMLRAKNMSGKKVMQQPT
jgi:hypothetical protein